MRLIPKVVLAVTSLSKTGTSFIDRWIVAKAGTLGIWTKETRL